ncbi:MAG: hypothetical protein LUI07_03360 [Lachnospiraceae bacterium]|nr:hypothetical protein [Lachnospiraceae bacterium]
MKTGTLPGAKYMAARAAVLLLFFLCGGRLSGMTVQAEDAVVLISADSEDVTSETAVPEETESTLTGTYTMAEGWSEDADQSTDGITVYVQGSGAAKEESSTISCSYLDTNYSRQEYEQLRDMLTNNLIYSNVDAQISTSAVYTLSMDYLYIVLVDDSSEDYRNIYNYVVGDYRCFCVQVKEYRAEAEQAQAQDQDTPQESGQKVAESFVWDISG